MTPSTGHRIQYNLGTYYIEQLTKCNLKSHCILLPYLKQNLTLFSKKKKSLKLYTFNKHAITCCHLCN